MRLRAFGVGVSAVGRNAPGVPQSKTGAPKTKIPPVSLIQANDGTSLFYRDWGTGPAVVFVAPWGLNSDWWEYQIAYLSAQALACRSIRQVRWLPGALKENNFVVMEPATVQILFVLQPGTDRSRCALT
jgi:hypothetical protein